MARSAAGVWAGYGLAVLIPLFLLLSALHIDRLQLSNAGMQVRHAVEASAGPIRARLEAEISARIALADSLGAFIVTLPDADSGQFSLFSESLLHRRNGVRSLQLAPQGRLTFVYPMAGNEAAVGHDLLNDPERATAVRRAIAERRTIMAGPYQLLQGGLGAVARKPIFIPGRDGPEFWGLAVVVLDVPPLLAEAGLTNPAPDRLRLALRGRDGEPAADAVFFGDAAIFDEDPILAPVAVGNGSWQMAVVPTAGWPRDWPGRRPFLLLVAVGAALAAGLGIALARQAAKLHRVVEAACASEALYHEMFLTNAAIKLLIDPDAGIVVDANDAAVAYYGYPREALLGMPVSRINTLSAEAILQEMADARANRRGFFRFTHRMASGALREVEVYSGPVTRDGRLLLHSIIHDVTERVRLEDELRRSNAELEQFAYAASHDLREPLRMVSSFVALVIRRYGPQLDDAGRELLGFAEDGAKRMDRMIVDLLEYSRVGRLERPMQRWPLGELIAAAVHPLAMVAVEAKAVIDVASDLPEVIVNRDEVVRALSNLIGNAVKYHRPEVPPQVAISARRDGDRVVVSVSDNGIGIGPDYFDRIFLLFQRLHSRDQYPGTGIGLALVKKVVERHGGKVWVESEGENRGATFYVSLPAG